MGVVQVNPQEAIFYSPDGVNAPLTLQFPLTTDWPEGTQVKLQNTTDSETPVTFLAQGSDTIAQPSDTSVFAASHSVTTAGVVVTYMRVGTQWRVCDFAYPRLGQQCLNLFGFAAYGSLGISAPVPLPGDLGATWDTVDVFDTQNFVARGVTVSIVNSSFAFQYDGIYRVSFVLNYQHDISQSGRQTHLRLYNLTDGVAGSSIAIGIGRNQDATLITGSFLFEVVDANKNKEFVLQIGNGDAIVVASIEAATWEVNAVSEWRDSLGAANA